MRSAQLFSGLALCSWIVLGITGCEDANYDEYSKAPLNETSDHAHDHDHDHAHEGKHGGHVLELDDTHGHHAELVFDSATRDITVYFYGSEIGVGVAATDFVFEIEQDGKELVLESKAQPMEGETDATASRYVVAGAGVPEAIKSEEQLDGHFHVTLGGKEFVGEMHAHSHDEADHAHGEAEHKHDDADHKDEDKASTDVPPSK